MPAFVQKNGIQKRKRAQKSLANKKKAEKQKRGQGGGKAQKQGADGKITPFGFLLYYEMGGGFSTQNIT